MSYRRFLRRLREYVGAAPSRPRPRKPARRRPLLETLEDRTLPSVTATLASPVATTEAAVVNVSKRPGNQQESTIAVNPINPAQLCVISNVESANPGVFVSTSPDAGATWTGRIVGSGSGSGGDGLPAACCDPEAAWDQFGNLFLTYLGDNDDIVVLLSTDGGKTFAVALDSTDAGGGPDQPAIAVGAGSVWVSWTDSNGDMEATGARVTGPGTLGTFKAPQVLPNSGGGDFGGIAIGPTGQVLVTYQYGLTNTSGPDTIVVNQDPAGIAGTFGNAITVTATQIGGDDTSFPAQSNNLGIDAEANLAWDRSGGPHNGRVYLVYTDAPSPSSSDSNIFLRHSDDNGASWSSPLRVNDDKTTFSQFLPSISVDQSTGAVGIAWYDARNDPGSGPGDTDGVPNTDAEMFAAVSSDGGQTIGPNVQLSPRPSNSADSEPPDFAGDRPLGYGDFETSDYADGAFYRIWADNSNSTGDNPDGTLKKLDLYTARLAVAPETVTATADPGNNVITVRLDPTGNYIDVYQNTPTTGTPTFIAALKAVKNLVVQGGPGNDLLVVDTGNGNPLPAGGLSFAGGGGPDALLVQGGGLLTNEVYTGGGPGSGTITLDGLPLSFSGVSSYADGAAATNFTVNGTAAGEVVNVVNAPGKVNGLTATEVNGGASPTFLAVDFAGKTNVTVSGAAGSDSVTLNNPAPAAGMTRLTIDGGSGDDQLDVQAVAAGVTTTARDLAGNDTINVSSDAPTNGGTLAGLVGQTLVVDVDGAGTDTLNISERSRTTADAVTVDTANHRISATAGWAVDTSPSAAFAGGVHLFLGSGGDTVNVRSTAAGELVTVDGGPGADTYDVTAAAVGSGGVTLADSGTDNAADQYNIDAGNQALTLTTGTPGVLSYQVAGSGLVSQGDTDTVFGVSVNNLPDDGLTLISNGGGVADGKPDATRISRSGANFVFTQDNGNATSFGLAFPMVKIHQVEVGGTSDSDALVLDFTGGSPIPANNLFSYDGGSGGGNFLILQGGSFSAETDAPTGAAAGGYSVTDGGQTYSLTYANVLDITDTTPSAGLTIDGTTGADAITVTNGPKVFTADDPAGTVTTTVGSLGFAEVDLANKTALAVAGLGGNDSVTVNATTPGPGLAALAFTGGAGDDVVNVLGTAATYTTSIDGNGGSDTVDVGSTPAALGRGTLAGVLGGVLVADTGGGATLDVDDGGDATGRTLTVGATSVAVGSAGAVSYTGLVGGNNNVVALNVYAGTGNDTINVTGTDASVTTAVSGGGGDDSFHVGSGGTLDNIAGPLSLDGGTAGANGNTATFDDSTQTGAQGYTLTSGRFSRAGGPTVDLSNFVRLAVNGGSAADAFTVTASATVAYVLQGGAPTTPPGDTLTYAGGGTLTLTGPRAGTISAAGVQDVTYTDVETVGATGKLALQVDAGSLGIGGDGKPDAVLLQGAGTSFNVSVNGAFATAGLTAGYSSIAVTGSADDDTLAVDFTNGKPIPSGGARFAGGGGTDSLVLQGNGTITNEAYTPGALGSGTVSVDGAPISFSGVSSYEDSATATNFTVNGTGAGEAINVADAPAKVNGFTATEVNGGASPTFLGVAFANKAHATVSGQGGGDTFTVNNPNPAAGLTSLKALGGAGADSFAVTATGAALVTLDGGAGADTYGVAAAAVGSGGVALDDSGTDLATDRYQIDATNNPLTLTTGAPGALSYQVSGAGLVSQADADAAFGFTLANVPKDGLTLVTNGGGAADGKPDSTTVGQDGAGNFTATLDTGGVPFLSLPFPMAEVHQVQVGGTADADTLVVDFSHGSPIPAGGLGYDGGGGSNALVLRGGTFAASADTPGAPASTYTFDAASLSYAHVAAITDTNTVAAYTVSGLAAAAALVVGDGPGDTTQVSSGGTAATVDFANKQRVTVAGQGGDDTLTVNNPHPAAGLQALALAGGDGADAFDVTPSAAVALSVDGGNPTSPPGDTLTYEGGGTLTPSGTAAGAVSSTGVKDVTFTGVETVGATGTLSLQVSTKALGVGGDGTPDTVSFQGAGADFNVSFNGAFLIGGVTGNFAGVSVVGSSDADTLVVDFTGGNPVPPTGLSYDGGGGSNTLVLKGGSFTNETDVPAGAQAGTVTLDGSAIPFRNVTEVADSAAAANFTIDGTAAADTIHVVNAPSLVNGFTATEVNAGASPTFATVDFANKASVFVSGQGGGDAFTVNNPNPAAGLTSLKILGGAGADSFAVTATGAALVTLDGGAGADTYGVAAAAVGSGGVALDDSGTDLATDRYQIDATNNPLTLTTGAPGALSYQASGAGVVLQDDTDAAFGFGLANVPKDGLTLDTNGGGAADGKPDTTTVGQDGSGNFTAILDSGGVPFLSLPFPMAEVHQVQVGGTADADTLVVDFSHGSPIPAGGLSYDGGGGSNALVLRGGTFAASADTPGSPANTYTFDAASLSYAHVAAITDTNAVTAYTVSGLAAAAALVVGDGPGGTTEVSSGGAAATVDFANKQRVTVAGQGGDDTLTVNNPHPAAGLQALALSGGDGADAFDVTPSAAVALSVDGGPPATPPGDVLTYEGTGTQTLSGVGAGTISGAGVQDVVYTGIEMVNVGGQVALQVSTTAAGVGGDGSPDTVLLQGAGPDFNVAVNGKPFLSGVTSGYSSITVVGSTDADTLTVDFTGGNPVPSGGVSFFGSGGSDELALKGGLFAGETIAPSGPQAGTVTLGNSTVAFTGTSTLDDAAGATDLTILATSAGEPINVVDDPGTVFGFRASQVNSGARPTFATVHFANKTNVSVQGVGGSDTFTLNNPRPAAGLATLALQGSAAGNVFLVGAAAVPTTINAGAGSDTVTLHDASNSFAGLTAALTVNAQGGAGNVLNAANDDNFVLTDSRLTSVKAGVAVNLDGHFQTANLAGGPSAARFDVSGWHGNGSLDGTANAAGNDTVTATNADAGFTLSNGALARSGGRGTMTLVNIGVANLTDTGGGHTFDVGGWTGAGTLTGDPGRTDTLAAAQDASTITLANGSLKSSAGTNLALVHLAQANLTGGAHANAFDLSGWTGSGSVTGGGGADSVTAAKDVASFTLGDAALATGDGMRMNLAGLGTALLTGTGATANAFDVSGWTGNGSVNGGGGSNTVSATKDTGFTLSDGRLSAGDGMNLTLSAVRTADLSGGSSANGFDVSGWTGGGRLAGGGGSDTVTATKDVTFILTDAGLQTTDGMNLALAAVGNADLTGGASPNAFDVSGWHGNGALDGQGGSDTVTAGSAADFILDDGFLTRGGGFGTLALHSVEFAGLTDTGSNHRFDVGGWTHPGTLAGAGSDSVAATRDSSFTLTNAALTDGDGLSVGLSGITSADLKGGPGPNAFDVSAWTHGGSLTGVGGNDTVTATKNVATFFLGDGGLTTGDGMRLGLAGVTTADLAGGGAVGTTFDVSAWTGHGNLAGGTGPNVVAAGKDANFTLADDSLATGDGMVLALARIRTANLSSGPHSNDFDVSGWTGGGRLVGGGGSDTVTATKDTGFVLGDTELKTGDGMDVALVAVTAADLTGGPSDNAFDVSGWHGGGRIDGGGGTNTILSAKDTDFTLGDSVLATGDGMALALARVQVAHLTGGPGSNTFDVGGWTGGGTLDGGSGGADEVSATRDASFGLSDSSLTDSAGLGLTLAHVGLASLTGGPGGNAFTVAGWTGSAALDGAGGSDSYDVTFTGGAGSTTVRDSGSGGQDSLTVRGTGGGGDLTVSGNQVSRGAETVTFSGVESETVLAGGGVNRVTVLVTVGFALNVFVDAGPSPASTLAVVDATAGGVFHVFPAGPGGLVEAHFLNGPLNRITYALASGQVAAPAALPSFVQSLFYAVFGRVGAAEELAPLAALLQNPRRSAARLRRQLVDRMEKSSEGRRHRVEVWFQTYLGRDASAFEMAHYGGLLRSHTEEEVLARLLTTGEFFEQAGGTLAGLESLVFRRLAGILAGSSSTAVAGASHGAASHLARVVAFLKTPALRMAVLHAEYGRLFPAGSVAGPAEVSFIPLALRLDLHGLRALLESSTIFFTAG